MQRQSHGRVQSHCHCESFWLSLSSYQLLTSPSFFLQKDLAFKEAIAIYIRSPAYFEFVINLRSEADRVAKLLRDLESKIGKFGPGISNADLAAAEKAAEKAAEGGKKGKGQSNKSKKGKEREQVEAPEDDEEEELERVEAMLKKLKKKNVSFSLREVCDVQSGSEHGHFV